MMAKLIKRLKIITVDIVIRHLNAKIAREEIYRTVTGTKRKHNDSNDNGLLRNKIRYANNDHTV